MHAKNDTPSVSSARLIALAAATLVVLGSLGPIQSAQASPTTYELLFGVDKSFKRAKLNFDETTASCTDSTCSASSNTGEAESEATLSETSGTISREAFVGIQYKMKPACDGQDTHLAFEAAFTYNYTLNTDVAGAGSAEAKINLRGKSLDETEVSPVTARDGQDGSLAGDVYTIDIQLDPDVDNETIYRTTLGAFSEAIIVSPTLETEDRAHASAHGALQDVSLEFGDGFEPQSDVTSVASDATPRDSWYNQPVHVTVEATDPTQDGATGDTIPASCVERVLFYDDVGNEKQLLGQPKVNYQQDPVTFTLDESRMYELDVHAKDNNGNIQSAPTEVAFGVDTQLPGTGVSVDPAAPTGKNGWYNGSDPSVYFHVTCSDANGQAVGEYSGCYRIHYTDRRGSWRSGSVGDDDVSLRVREGADRSRLVQSEDYARNTDPVTETPIIDFDPTAPSIPHATSNSSVFGNGWYQDPVTLTLECADGTSGCASLETRPCGDPIWTTDTSYSYDQEGENCVEVLAEDVAGNTQTKQVNVNLDFTNPGIISGLSLDTAYNDRDGENYVQAAPAWSWNAATDELSGIQQYHVRLSKTFTDVVNHYNVSGTSFTGWGLSDGRWCIEVAAVDRAGNEGAFAGELVDESCAWLDTIQVDTEFTGPPKNHLILHDGTAIPVQPQEVLLEGKSDMTLTLDDVTLVLESSDPGTFPSGVWNSEIWLEADCDSLTCEDQYHECENPVEEQPERCVIVEELQGGTAQGIAIRSWRGEAEDRAGWTNKDFINYTQVDLSAVFQFVPDDANTPGQENYTDIYWREYTDSDFQRYEIWAGPSATFSHTDTDAREVAEITDATVTHAVDDAVATGDEVYYKLYVFTTASSLLPAHNSHAVELDLTQETTIVDDMAGKARTCVDSGSCL